MNRNNIRCEGGLVIKMVAFSASLSLSRSLSPALALSRSRPLPALAWRENSSEEEPRTWTCGTCHPTLTPSVSVLERCHLPPIPSVHPLSSSNPDSIYSLPPSSSASPACPSSAVNARFACRNKIPACARGRSQLVLL